jgi:hypothetical protein
MSDEKHLDGIIASYKEVISKLEEVKAEGNKDKMLGVASNMVGASVCCNACQAISSICVPDAAPNKCKGGCTVTSMVL